MMALLFEVGVFVTWAVVLIYRVRERSPSSTGELVVLLFAIPTTIVMELRSEVLLAGIGPIYPASLAYFPSFRFPIAIVLAGSLLTWAVYRVSRLGTARLVPLGGPRQEIALIGVFLILMTVSLAIEVVMVAVRYWHWQLPPAATAATWLGQYLYYLRFSLPAFLVGRLTEWHASERPGR